MNALNLDWNNVYRLSKSEFPLGVLEYLDARTITSLSDIRKQVLDSDFMRPSPVFGAHVRHSITGSRHSTRGKTRLSDATDFFAPQGWESALRIWTASQRVPEIGGIGIYVNRRWGRPMPMLHIDNREERLLWVCRKSPVTGRDQYIYLNSTPSLFFEVLAKGMNQ